MFNFRISEITQKLSESSNTFIKKNVKCNVLSL